MSYDTTKMICFSEVVCLQAHDLIRLALQILIQDEEEVLHEGCLTQTACPLQAMICSCELIQILNSGAV
jgi:hypothetical protein